MPRKIIRMGAVPPWLGAGLLGSVLTALAVLSGQAPMRTGPLPRPENQKSAQVPVRPVAHDPQSGSIQPAEILALAGRSAPEPAVRVLLTRPLQNGALRVLSATGLLVTDPVTHKLLAHVPGNAVFSVRLSPDGRALSGPGAKDLPTKRIRITPIVHETPMDIGGRTYLGSLEVSLGASGLDVVNEVPQESYIAGVLCGEVPASFPLEALKAQAVAARTYAFSQSGNRANGVDVVDTVADQVYLGASRVWPECRQAVQETAGQVATHNGRPIVAYFSADCGGWTRTSAAGFGGRSYPYLQPVRDADASGKDFCATSPSHTWSARLAMADLLPRIRATIDPDLEELKTIRFSQVYQDGRVGEVTLEGFGAPQPPSVASAPPDAAEASTFPEPAVPPGSPDDKAASMEANPSGGSPPLPSTGTDAPKVPTPDEPASQPMPAEEGTPAAESVPPPSAEPERPVIRHFLKALDFRRAIGTSLLRSQIMSIEPDGEDAWIFRGRGYGHGVGLCQWGAKGRAMAGQTYAQILKAYYTGIELSPAPPRNGTLTGVVTDASGVPVQKAMISLVGTDREVVTDALGRYRFENLPRGTYDIVVTPASGSGVMSFGWAVQEKETTSAPIKFT